MTKMAEVEALQAEVRIEGIDPKATIESRSRLAPKIQTQARILQRQMPFLRQKAMPGVSPNGDGTIIAIAEVEAGRMETSRPSSSNISQSVRSILLTKGKCKRLRSLSAKR